MQKILVITFLCFIVKTSFSQSVPYRIFLIGDTGEDDTLQETMKNFIDTIDRYPHSAAIFLGDNSYKKYLWVTEKKGFDSGKITMKRVGAQLKGLENYKGRVYFVPGNHDWWNCTNFKRGKRKLSMEESFITETLSHNLNIANHDVFQPSHGNPIAAVDLNNNDLKIIFIDTHWLILKNNKKDFAASQKVYLQLDSIIHGAAIHNQRVIVTSHHPIFSVGRSSTSKRKFLFTMLKDQDMYYPSFDSARAHINSILKKYPECQIIYANGHDHTLQYFRQDSISYIVSGAGSKTTPFNKKFEFNPKPNSEIPAKRLTALEEGFFEIDFTNEGSRIIMHSNKGTIPCHITNDAKCSNN